VIHGGKMFSDQGGTLILDLPIEDFAVTGQVSSLEARRPRKALISSDKVWGPEQYVQELRLTLPEGWHAKLPPNVDAKSIYGEYQATYAQVGRELQITRSRTGTHGVFGADTYDALIDYLKAISKDDVKVIILEK
jgi:hypothetical protein